MAKHFDNKDLPLNNVNNRIESNVRPEVLSINDGNFQNHPTSLSQDIETSAIDEHDENHNFQNHETSFREDVETTAIDEQDENHFLDSHLFIYGCA